VKVLVTGATSLLGRATVDLLIARGDDVTVFQRSEFGGPVSDAVSEVLGDINNPDDVAAAVDGQSAIIHLAAKVAAVGQWHDFARVNIEGTEGLLNSARQAGVGRVVHVSSPSVAHGGDALVGVGANPADPTATEGGYATSKAYGELSALAASRPTMPVVAIRPHLVWGPGDEQLVGRIVERARSGRLAIIGSGGALIDSTYVTNAADALVAALDRAPDLAGRALVVSNGEPRMVSELVTRIVLAAGLAAPKKRVPTAVAIRAGAAAERVWSRLGRTDDPPMTRFLAEQLSTAHWFDQRETRAALGWVPAVSLDEGFRRLAASFAGSL
jgi:2-alkyl-3-oxoalkanoate reductase